MKYVCEHIKSYLFQLAAPFVGKCHLFYYDVWRIKGMRKMDFLFVRLALKKNADYLFDNQRFWGRAASQTWTGDLRVTNALLYQLSYSGNGFSITRCKGTSLFEFAKRIAWFFRNISVWHFFYICVFIGDIMDKTVW